MSRENAVGEALVVAKIEIGFRAVVEHINFSVLERVHRPGINIEIGIKFLENDSQTTGFEQRAKRGRGQAFA